METIVLRCLPPEPDGTRRVCIHWLYLHPEGKIATVDNMLQTNMGPKILAGKRWRMACDHALTNMTTRQGSRLIPTPHSDDPRAVTCPKCMATAEFKAAMEVYENTIPVSGVKGA